MFRRILAFTISLLLCTPLARAEQVLKRFTVKDLTQQITVPGMDNFYMKMRPLWDPDQTTFELTWPDIPTDRAPGGTGSPLLFSVDLTESTANADAITGLMLASTMVRRVAGLSNDAFGPMRAGFSAPSASFDGPKAFEAAFPFKLPDLQTSGGVNLNQDALQPFRIPLPKNQKHIRFYIWIPDQGQAIFSNVRLVKDSPATTEPNNLAPPARIAFPANLQEQIVREFSGNDFNSKAFTMGVYMVDEPVMLYAHSERFAFDAEVRIPAAKTPRSIPVLSVDDPPVTQNLYAIAGDISYNGVQGDTHATGSGYLEMCSDFTDGSSITTNALADTSMFREISGRSGPRSFLLPFDSGNKHLTRIRMNLIMTGRGNVTLNHLRLLQYLPKPSPAAAVSEKSAWLNPRLAWIGITLLPFVALIAFLEPLIRRGMGRRIVMTWIWIWFALGQICFAWGMAALGHGESFREIGPLLLTSIGVWLAMLFASRRMGRRYRDAELKRMQLMDIVRP